MHPYPKIHSIFRRDKGGKFTKEFACPEFEYLRDNEWMWTEKVDGTNVRVMWHCVAGEVRFGGRTDRAQMPTFLIARLQELFPPKKFVRYDYDLCLYGEGYGAGIQRGGGKYKADGVDFVLFDVKVGDWWLRREAIEDIASWIGIMVVPIMGEGTLNGALDWVEDGLESRWGEFEAEGLVLKPKTELRDRAGRRIITKVKTKDFK